MLHNESAVLHRCREVFGDTFEGGFHHLLELLIRDGELNFWSIRLGCDRFGPIRFVRFPRCGAPVLVHHQNARIPIASAKLPMASGVESS